MKQSQKIIIVVSFTIISLLVATGLIESARVYGEMRDPFSLPPGVRLLSKGDSAPATKGPLQTSERGPASLSSSPLRVKAILISDHIRLASIDRHIVTVGDSIQGERILEIENDRVILGKGDKKRTLYLFQGAISLRVEEEQGERR
ncbi:MAG: hypothetical protein HXY46_00080 [Syntrophaceae bacterium]|nr:hypothetical protein [Syntrophaceae bacterium]